MSVLNGRYWVNSFPIAGTREHPNIIDKMRMQP